MIPLLPKERSCHALRGRQKCLQRVSLNAARSCMTWGLRDPFLVGKVIEKEMTYLRRA